MIYSNICECQTLFPDPEQSNSEEEDGDESLGDDGGYPSCC